MISVDLDNVGLKFRLRHLKRLTLKELLIGRLHGQRPVANYVEALRGIDLHVGEGERLGVIGRNGAGKSTLLRLIAGIYPATRGERRVQGRISSLFEIAHGFEMDATGWENMYFRGYLQGESPRSIRAKVQSIADFSELGQFLDMPVRCYSSGMLVRLAFSITTAIEPEILLIDESLSVGDIHFQQKARRRMQEMMAKARLIIIVSHDLSSIQDMCSRGLWLDHGQVRAAGPIQEVVRAYQVANAASPVAA
jgi:ABC-type polysaccharide/polyol phosphate transport system ATPase subunit